MLSAAEGRAVPGPSSGQGASRTPDATHQKRSWGGEVAGARVRGSGGKAQVLEDGLGRRGAEDDSDDVAGAAGASGQMVFSCERNGHDHRPPWPGIPALAGWVRRGCTYSTFSAD